MNLPDDRDILERKCLNYKWKWMVGDRVIAPSGKISYVIEVGNDEITMVNHDGKIHKERPELLQQFFEDLLLFEDTEYILERGCNLDDDLFTI